MVGWLPAQRILVYATSVDLRFVPEPALFLQSRLYRLSSKIAMAATECWPLSICTSADSMPPEPDNPSSKPSQTSDSNRTHGRWTVCLNEPTVASLRRRAVISTQQNHNYTATTMPATTGSSSLLASLPTFMSVFGEGSASQDNARIKSSSQPTSASSRPSSRSQYYPTRSSAFQHTPSDSGEHRRGSAATIRTESTESSPTTTISTVDSTLTDPSPSSSPESPASSLPLSTLTAIKTSPPTKLSRMDSQNDSPDSSPFSQSIESPKRPRNTKNLSINTTGISTKQSVTSSLAGNLAHLAESTTSSLPTFANPKTATTAIPGHLATGSAPKDRVTGHAFSAPVSPSFIVPSIPPPRKSRLGLTITTSGRETFASVPDTPSRAFASMPLRPRGSDSSGRLGTVPETPALGPLSRMREGHGSSDRPLFSPSVAPTGGMSLPPFGHIDPTLPTPGYGPAGGMQLPPLASSTESSPYERGERLALNLPLQSFDTPGSGSVVQHTVEHNPQTPLHDLPLSREAKSPGYPNGPICIYPPSVFLYHQPTREEAREFDVIINVAREVANPFLAEEEVAKEQAKTTEPKYKDAGVQCSILPGELDPVAEPPSAVSNRSFTSALENFLPEDGPETPKAATTPSMANADPEYIHLPWEHNSKVYDEWFRVCELIDERVKLGKKVLIHCQLGVSRSASLIVAYGIYKNPRLSPDEARENAKKQSRWIDLNMHFMYELGDFRKLLAEKYPSGNLVRRAAPSMGLKRTTTDSFLVTGTHSHEPMPTIADESSTTSKDQSLREATNRQEDESLPSPSNVPLSAPAGGNGLRE